MNKLKIILVIVFACFVAFLLTILKPKVEKKENIEKGMLVEAFYLKPQSVNMIVETYGTVEPKESLKFIAEVGGQTTEASPLFEEGGYVKKGTKLLTIDRRSFELEFKSASAGKMQADAAIETFKQNVKNLEISVTIERQNFKLAEAEYKRFKTLFERNVIAKTTVDKAEQAYLGSLNNLENFNNQLKLTASQYKEVVSQKNMADAAKKQAKLRLEKTEITAPFNGYILEKAIKKREYVAPGTYLGSIYKENSFEIVGNINQKDVRWVSDINSNPLNAEVFFDNFEDEISFFAKAVRIKSAIDINTRTLPVVVEINAQELGKNQKKILRPGMFVKIFIKGTKRDGVYILPANLVRENNIINIAKNNRLIKKEVEVIRIFKGKAYITKGISEKDLIIKTDIAGAAEGMVVRTSLKND